MFKKIKEKIDKKYYLSKKTWDMIEVGIFCGIAILAAYLFITFIAQRTVVAGDSMYNTLADGDNIIVEKLSYTFGEIERFDIVVFPYIDEVSGEEVYYIKRIIGMPGETLMIKDGLVYLIDEETGEKEILTENYGYYADGNEMEGYRADEPVHIMDGCYFVLGDNRNHSKDSRQMGLIKGEDIVGKAWLRFYPFEDFEIINHR